MDRARRRCGARVGDRARVRSQVHTVILAIETATELVGVCLGETRPEAEIWVRGHRRHAESLAPAIRFVLDRTGIDLEALEAVAVDVGPGLFTGIRVGVASAKAFAAALGIGV